MVEAHLMGQEKMKLSLLILVLLLQGCVLIPKEEDPYDKQAKKYPRDSEQLKQLKLEHEKQKDIDRLKPNTANRYTVGKEVLDSWGIGSLVAENKSKYHHEIRITLNCNDGSPLPVPYGRKNIKWIATKDIFGQTQTSINGEVDIRFVTSEVEKLNKLTIVTDKKEYTMGLEGILYLNMDPIDCSALTRAKCGDPSDRVVVYPPNDIGQFKRNDGSRGDSKEYCNMDELSQKRSNLYQGTDKKIITKEPKD